MDGPADERLLALDGSDGRRILLRQPGKGRDLRMRHSVWNQNLLSLGVVRDS